MPRWMERNKLRVWRHSFNMGEYGVPTKKSQWADRNKDIIENLKPMLRRRCSAEASDTWRCTTATWTVHK
eukprot:5147657-Prorocentrum_lima.AAC.1